MLRRFHPDRITPPFVSGEISLALDFSLYPAKRPPVDSPRSETSPPPAAALDAWFAQEVQPHETGLRSYLRSAFPGLRDVDDVVQESYLRIIRSKADRPVRHARGFVFQIARRLALDLIRRARISPEIGVAEVAELPVLDDAPDAAVQAALNDELTRLAHALNALPPRLREVMVLRKLEGLSQREIAGRLGLSENTVQVHVVRGFKRLQEIYAEADRRRLSA